MSNALAIAAVTSTLRSLIELGIQNDPRLAPASIAVTTRPPAIARGNNRGPQLNLFLYQVQPNAAHRNADPRPGGRNGELAYPPLALNLHYMVTVYGEDNDGDELAQCALGRALSTLHDHSVLGAAEIRSAPLPGDAAGLAKSGLDQQIERVRLTLQPLSLEEVSKMWAAFSSPYHLSTAFEAAVVLIDSTRAGRSAAPVLKRGTDDRGLAPLATIGASLDEARPDVPGGQPSVQLGEDLLLRGSSLGGDGLRVRLVGPGEPKADDPDPPAFPREILLVPLPPLREDRLRVHLPSPVEDPQSMSRFAPGFYRAAVLQRPELPPLPSNEVPVTLAPRITVTPSAAVAGDLSLTVTCAPRVRDGQRVRLLFGADRQVAPDTTTNPATATLPTTFKFTVPGVAKGSYLVRLRVDGVDSLPAVRTGNPPILSFASDQQVTIS